MLQPALLHGDQLVLQFDQAGIQGFFVALGAGEYGQEAERKK
jgi:hypothetical protein